VNEEGQNVGGSLESRRITTASTRDPRGRSSRSRHSGALTRPLVQSVSTRGAWFCECA